MRYVWRDGELIPKHLAPRVPVARSSLPAPYIRSDGMDATLNHANGLLYDSKSAYERAVKDAGCEIVGNDSAFQGNRMHETTTPGGLENDIKDAIDQLGGI